MIATVRIAPIERWCEAMLQILSSNPGAANAAGDNLTILPGTMRISPDARCQGKEWEVLTSDREAIEQKYLGHTLPVTRAWACEHMLEMD